MEHTPGPWISRPIPSDEPDDHFSNWIDTEDGAPLADIRTRPDNEHKANANLIAAAPDLLEVLEELLENGTCYLSAIELDHNYDGEEWEKKARTAIAKAKGQ